MLPEYTQLLRLPQQNGLPNTAATSPMLLVRPPTQQPMITPHQLLQQQQQVMARRASIGHPPQLSGMAQAPNVALPPHLAALAQATPAKLPAQRLVLPTTSQGPSAPIQSVSATLPTTSSNAAVCNGLPTGCGPDDERYQAFLSTVRQLQQHMLAFTSVFPVAAQLPTQASAETPHQEEPKAVSEPREIGSHEL